MTARRFLKLLLVCCACALIYSAALSYKGLGGLPPLQDGDIIFQSNFDPQALAITFASRSIYTHTGIIKKTPEGYNVIEAAHSVGEISLSKWVARGLKRFAVYRYKGLTPEQGAKVVAATKRYYGRPYDIYFYFDDSKIYCSELPYLAYQDIGLEIGKVETFSELSLDNKFAQTLIEQRWEGYPACKGQHYTFKQCYDVIMSGKIITPVSIADDEHFELIYTNYRL